jgi:large subunit ribosomal protein L23
MSKDIHSILRRPLVTEKTTALKDDRNQVAFVVRRDATKNDVRRAVEALLGARVTDVNTMIYRGKPKRVGRNFGKRPNWKKAIVTLAPGEEVDFFGALEELEEAPAE